MIIPLTLLLGFTPIDTSITKQFHVVDDSLIPPKGWTEVAPMPLGTGKYGVKLGGWLSTGDNGSIYGAKGNKSGDFYVYSTGNNQWTPLAPIPDTEGKPPYKGTKGVFIGNGEIMLSTGNNQTSFLKYDPSTNSWEKLTDIPEGPSGKGIRGGNDMVLVQNEHGNFVYVLKGYKTEFWKYDLNQNTWLQLPNAPTGVKEKYDKGSFLVYDGENTIFAHKAKYVSGTNHEMWKFDTDQEMWDTLRLTGMPLNGLHGGRTKSKKSKDGASGAWIDGRIRALKGGNTQQFFEYSLLEDDWKELDTIPTNGSSGKKRRVKQGADLVSCNGVLYALKGNKTLEMWRYGGAYTLDEVVKGNNQVQSEKTLESETSTPTIMTRQQAIPYGLREQIRQRINPSGRVISKEEWEKGNLPSGVYFIFDDKKDSKVERIVVTN